MSAFSREFCTFNRVVVAVISLVALLGCIGVLLDPQSWIGALDGFRTELSGAAFPGSLVALPGLVVVGLAALILFVVEIWPRSDRRILIVSTDAGAVEYPIAIVADAIANEVSVLDGVRQARVEVSPEGRKARALVQLWLDSAHDPPAVSARVASRVREKIGALGLQPGLVRVAIQSEPAARPRETRTAA